MNSSNAPSKQQPVLIALLSVFLIAAAFFHNLSYQPWIYLSVLGTCLAAACFYQKTIYFPKNGFKIFIFALVVFAGSSLLNGGNLTEERWLSRYAFFVLCFTFIQFFKTESDAVENLKWPLTAFLLFSSFQSLYQYVAFYNPDSVLAHSTHAASFWNISHYSQAVVVSLPLLLLFHKYSSEKLKILYGVIIVAISTSILIGITRATYIGLGIFFFTEFVRPLTLKRKTTAILVALSLVFSAALFFSNQTTGSSIDKSTKSRSIDHRKVLISKALQMGQENPTGVGVNNFAFKSFGYTEDKNSQEYFNISEIPNSPHSEPLRIFDEEGTGVFILYCIALLFLVGLSIKKIFIEKSRNVFFRFLLCLLPEIAFHFPSELYFPTFLFAVFAAIYLPKAEIVKPSYKKIALAITVCLALFTTASWIIRNEKIVPKEYAPTFCSVYHDDWRMCRKYYADLYLDRNYQAADQVVRPILKYQPYNYFFLMLDYSLAVEPKSSVVACLYYNLFEGKLRIENSDLSKCTLETDRVKVRAAFSEFSERR